MKQTLNLLSCLLLLTACSSDPDDLKRAKGNFDYLDAELSTPLVRPEDSTVTNYPDYEIPQGTYTGVLGDQLDIRPLQQVLVLIPGA